jgi:hypothetical protein
MPFNITTGKEVRVHKDWYGATLTVFMVIASGADGGGWDLGSEDATGAGNSVLAKGLGGSLA